MGFRDIETKKAYLRRYYQQNRERLIKKQRIYYQLNSARIKNNSEIYRNKHEYEVRQYMKDWRMRNDEYKRYSDKRWYQVKRLRILLIISNGQPPKCVMCGIDDIDVLQKDHILGGGRQEWVMKFHKSGSERDNYCIKNPEYACKTYQILCANCNIKKRIANKEWGKKYLNPLNIKPMVL